MAMTRRKNLSYLFVCHRCRRRRCRHSSSYRRFVFKWFSSAAAAAVQPPSNTILLYVNMADDLFSTFFLFFCFCFSQVFCVRFQVTDRSLDACAHFVLRFGARGILGKSDFYVLWFAHYSAPQVKIRTYDFFSPSGTWNVWANLWCASEFWLESRLK